MPSRERAIALNEARPPSGMPVCYSTTGASGSTGSSWRAFALAKAAGAASTPRLVDSALGSGVQCSFHRSHAESHDHFIPDLDGRHASPRVEKLVFGARSRIFVDVVFLERDSFFFEVRTSALADSAPNGRVHHDRNTPPRSRDLPVGRAAFVGASLGCRARRPA